MDLVGGKVFRGFVGEHAEDRSPLRGYTQAASPKKLAGVHLGAIRSCLANQIPGSLVKTMSYLGVIT